MGNKVKKNVIVIHMESLSNVIYNGNRSLFKCVNEISNNCIVYNNFYSSSTSTIMVIADLLFGDMRQYEGSTGLNNHHSDNYVKESLFELLESDGYSTKTIVYPKWKEYDINNLENVMQNISYKDTYDDFEQEISKSIYKDKPFAIYLYNGLSGLSFFNEDKNKEWSSSWKEGYIKSDNTIGYVFSLLKRENILNNTVILIFGDHGDDFWTHSFNNGFCHCIEPYGNIVNTPLFVYDSSIFSQDVDDLISTVDIRSLILSLLKIKEDEYKSSMIYDKFRSKRKNALSRNLFVNQSESNSLPLKSYSLSNAYYNMLVSKYGLEFYFKCCDPTNHCNLLNFYNMNLDGKITFKREFNNISNRHFVKAMNMRRINDIERDFYEMRSELITQVKKMYQSVKSKEKLWNQELDFNCINNRGLY